MSAGAFSGFGGLSANISGLTGFFAGQRTLQQDRQRAEEAAFDRLFKLRQAQVSNDQFNQNLQLSRRKFSESVRQFDASLDQQEDVQQRLADQFKAAQTQQSAQFGQKFKFDVARETSREARDVERIRTDRLKLEELRRSNRARERISGFTAQARAQGGGLRPTDKLRLQQALADTEAEVLKIEGESFDPLAQADPSQGRRAAVLVRRRNELIRQLRSGATSEEELAALPPISGAGSLVDIGRRALQERGIETSARPGRFFGIFGDPERQTPARVQQLLALQEGAEQSERRLGSPGVRTGAVRTLKDIHGDEFGQLQALSSRGFLAESPEHRARLNQLNAAFARASAGTGPNVREVVDLLQRNNPLAALQRVAELTQRAAPFEAQARQGPSSPIELLGLRREIDQAQRNRVLLTQSLLRQGGLAQ